MKISNKENKQEKLIDTTNNILDSNNDMINITNNNNNTYINKIDKEKEDSYKFHIGLDRKKILKEQIKNASRYDSFITMYIFILHEYINNINITPFKLLNEFEKLISNVKMIPDENKRNDIFQFCIDNQIDIL